MLNEHTKKTALEHKVSVASKPLPGTEPGAGSLRSNVNFKSFWNYLRIALAFIALGAVLYGAFAPKSTVQLGRGTFKVQVVETEQDTLVGLSETKSLESDRGMLFIFPGDDYWPIWMKDMNFAIDIIWLDANKQVVTIHRNISPDTYPKGFIPVKPARYVLEIPAGAADAAGIADGQTAIFKL